MSVWTMDQIRQVRGLRAKAHVDITAEPQWVIDAKAATRAKMVKHLTGMAHPFAVECSPADFQFSETEDEGPPFCSAITCWWEPDTREVEFHGGQNDGLVLEVERVGMTIMVAEMQGVDCQSAVTGPDELRTPFGVRYELTGWDETNRRWVYSRAS